MTGKAPRIEANNNTGGQGLAVESNSRVDLGFPLVANRSGDRYNILVDTCSSLRIVGDDLGERFNGSQARVLRISEGSLSDF